MLSCMKFIHFLLSSGPCLTKQNNSEKLESKQKLTQRAKFAVFDRIVYSYFAGNLWKVHKVVKWINRLQAFPRNILFPWPPCFLKSLLCNETTIRITRLINFLMVLYILRADSVYFIFHQVSLSKYSMKTIGIQLFLTNVKFRRRNLKNDGVLPL